jgi:hypothetical protein
MPRPELLAELERLAVEAAASRARLVAIGDALAACRDRLATARSDEERSAAHPHEPAEAPPPEAPDGSSPARRTP